MLALEAVPITGGALGTQGVPKFAIFGISFANDIAFYYAAWTMAFICVAIGLNIDRSRIGRALKAIAASETAAGSVGIDIVKYKVQMFVISAGMASVAGSLGAHYLRAMDPNVYGFAYSLNLLTAVIIGGLTSIWGGALGATVITGLRELLRSLSLPLWESVIMGTLTVVVLIAFPRRARRRHRHAVRSPRRAAPAGRARSRSNPDPCGAVAADGCAGHGHRDAGGAGLRRARSAICARSSNVSFNVETGSIVALIGPNGAGKTTLFNLIGGYQPLNAGSVKFLGEPIEDAAAERHRPRGIGRTFQNLQLFDNMTVLENVMCGRYPPQLVRHSLDLGAAAAGRARGSRDAPRRAGGARLRRTSRRRGRCRRRRCRSVISGWSRSRARSRCSRSCC